MDRGKTSMCKSCGMPRDNPSDIAIDFIPLPSFGISWFRGVTRKSERLAMINRLGTLIQVTIVHPLKICRPLFPTFSYRDLLQTVRYTKNLPTSFKKPLQFENVLLTN